MPLNNVNIDIKNDKIYLEKPKKINKNQIEPKFINKME
jgi:hypothetical protein